MPLDEDAYDPDSFEDDQADYVPAFFARDPEEAETYCELLNDHDIPARCGADDEPIASAEAEHVAASQRGMTHGVPVLVPESLLDEASEIIADREDFEFDEEDDETDEEGDDYELEEVDEPEAFLDEEEDEDIYQEDEDLDDLEEDEDEDEEDEDLI